MSAKDCFVLRLLAQLKLIQSTLNTGTAVKTMDYDHFVIARVIHIIAVVLWIGGVAFVTTVLIPTIRTSQTPTERLSTFELLESKFSLQAKVTTTAAGLSGFYMLHVTNAWSSAQWWIYLMMLVWLIFSIVLFILEPLFLHQWFHQKARENPEKSFLVLQLMHVLLLLVSLAAIAGGVAGAHGLFH